MSKIVEEVLRANASYAANFGARAKLVAPPARRLAILTCMDARMDPAKFLGLAEGDAHVFRNAGGRASDDAIRSLVLSHKLLGTKEWMVIHHTECGLATFTDDEMADLLAGSLGLAELTAEGWRNKADDGGSLEGRYVKWLAFTDLAQSVVDDVQRIRRHPLVSGKIPIYGYIFDVKTGKLNEVPEATKAGAPV